jgi:threonine dehydratase
VSAWPLTMAEVLQARLRLRPWLSPTPLLSHPVLDASLGMRLLVKHENHQPTGAFKVRNGLSLVSALTGEERARGVVAATRGNHGLGLAWAGARLGCRVTVCVPRGNNADKNEAMAALGAEVVEAGGDYDESVIVAQSIAEERGACVAHSTNDRRVLAGAATLTLEILEERPDVDAIVVSVGGGSQAVGAITVVRAVAPHVPVYAVQAAGAPTQHDSWHAGHAVAGRPAQTIADGLATRGVYALTFEALRAGLAGFVTVQDAEIAEAMRLLLRATHTLVEPAGAATVAALPQLRRDLEGRTVAVVLSGANVDAATLRRVLDHEL